MPTREPRKAATAADVRAASTRCLSGRPEAPAVGGVGLEAEALPLRRAARPLPPRRALLDDVEGHPGTLRLLAALGPRTERPGELPTVAPVLGESAPRGRITPEPGGQLEYTTPLCATAAEALADLAAGQRALADALRADDVVLASVGLDVWSDAPPPQQLRSARYPAMAAYLDARGPAGATMMRSTCSLQVNLDLGDGERAPARWLAANLLAPLAVATFATSPVRSGVNGRAQVWQALDPTRTGIPRRLVAGDDDPVGQHVDAVLAADVLLVRPTPGTAVPGRSGWPFRSWLEDGDPVVGRPTVEDLDYHLTTLFPEVRARGYLELRSIDALPPRWQVVPVVLLAGALYDDATTHRLVALLERHRAALPGLLARAAAVGVADGMLCALAVEAWSFALDGARRLPPGWLPAGAHATVEAFLDRFTLRGRCPADELRDALAAGPLAALRWAREPELPVPVALP